MNYVIVSCSISIVLTVAIVVYFHIAGRREDVKHAFHMGFIMGCGWKYGNQNVSIKSQKFDDDMAKAWDRFKSYEKKGGAK